MDQTAGTVRNDQLKNRLTRVDYRGIIVNIIQL
jgi:hypothetical protein